jgi:hypothetical protein
VYDDADCHEGDRSAGMRQQHKRRLDDDQHDRRNDQDGGGDALHPDQVLDQLEPGGEGAIALRMLDGVRNLMGSNRDRRDRTAVKMLRQKPHHAILRIVVVAGVGLLHAHVGEPGLVEQVPREFSAGSR